MKKEINSILIIMIIWCYEVSSDSVNGMRAIYIVAIIAIVAIATGLGFIAGQMSVPVVPATKETLTITQRVTQAITFTVQQAASTQQMPSREELLAPIIEAAKKEGRLVIYSTHDRPSAEPLLTAFKAKYPFIDLQYVELGSVALYNKYVSERAAGAPTADILWSGGIDLQYKLILEGSAQPYRLTIYDKIPDIAKYRDLAYAPQLYLVAPMYNTEKIPKDLVPKSYGELLRLLTEKKDLFPPRSIASYDIERSSFGLTITYYLYKTEPELIKGILSAAGSIGVVLQPATGPQIEMVKTGQAVISIAAVANHAYLEAAKDPRVGVFIPGDVVIIVPEYMFITREAKNVNAAKLFLEFAFSEEGQRALAETMNVVVMINNPFKPEMSLSYVQANVKKVLVARLGDQLLDEIIKPEVRSEFIGMWRKWLGIG